MCQEDIGKQTTKKGEESTLKAMAIDSSERSGAKEVVLGGSIIQGSRTQPWKKGRCQGAAQREQEKTVVSEECGQGVHLELWRNRQKTMRKLYPATFSKSRVNQSWSLTKQKIQNRDGIMHALLPEVLAMELPSMLIKVNNPHANKANDNQRQNLKWSSYLYLGEKTRRVQEGSVTQIKRY